MVHWVFCFVLANRRTEEEGTGFGGTTTPELRTRAAVILGLDVSAATVANLLHHPDTCGLGIFLTAYRRVISPIISCTLESLKALHSSLVVVMLLLTSRGMKMQLLPWRPFKVFLLQATHLGLSLQRRLV